MGADEETYKAQQVERGTVKNCELYVENVPVYNLFQEVETQFRYVSGNIVAPTGLDYTGVMTHLNCFYEKDQIKDLMADLQIIERAFLRAKHG